MSLLHLFSLMAVGTVMGVWKWFFELGRREKGPLLFILAGVMGAFGADLFFRYVAYHVSFLYPFYSKYAIVIEACFGAWLGVFILTRCLRER